ncbi:unnamed protein product [Paramecium sonneborni]|uniref:TLDc domain-containing protein n=1 Tax=Paramecium sonneborni TaxID=65129 RepID=A0A8S1K339_9CILI|nr:unnamed protein product [Paramecium sonneborni]
MEGERSLNEDLHVPYQQFPTYQQKTIELFCQEYGHRDQKIQYLNLTRQSDIVRQRLQCIKCITGPYSDYRQDVAILKDVLKDDMNVLKYTKFQGNILQEFSNLYHSLNLDFTKDDIEFKFASYQKQILFLLKECKKEIMNRFDQYQELKVTIKSFVDDFKPFFDFNAQQTELIEYSKQGQNPHPKSQQKLNKSLDEYVKKIHEQNEKQKEQLEGKLKTFKEKVNDFTKKYWSIHICKLDQEMENIQNNINELKNIFSQNNFTKSELSNDYIPRVLQTISKDYEDTSKVENIKQIYTSIHAGLNYKLVREQLKNNTQKNLLFIFQCSNSQKFGAFINQQNPKCSLMFQLSKKQIYLIKQLPPNQSPLIVNQSANDNSLLLKFGNEDLVIQSTFTKCYSKLGQGFEASEYQIGNLEMHLANASEFNISALEIFEM